VAPIIDDIRTSSMAVTVRFAPSPTGRLHVGNVRTAILNWLFAKAQGGTFMLRLDDTDVERSTDAFAEGIREDLRWLGLAWALEERQSARVSRYAEAAERLKRSGRLYPCYETEDELDRKRKRQLARGLPPIYDRTGLKLDAAERAKLDGEGRRPHWRFRLANSEDDLSPLPTIVSWNDLIHGDQTVDVGSLSDPVVIRADGTFLYTFTSVVDDAELGITHVIRGDDHAGPRAAGLRSSQPADRRRRAGAVEAARRTVDPGDARGGAGADGARQLHGADRHFGCHRAAH
jgi:glutamyl-tRNA synthetase